MNVVGDIDVHEKSSISKDSKSTNFIWTMNVFSLAVSSLIFGSVSEAVHSECLRLGRESERMRLKEVAVERVKYIGAKSSYRLQTQDLFLCRTSSFGIQTCGCS